MLWVFLGGLAIGIMLGILGMLLTYKEGIKSVEEGAAKDKQLEIANMMYWLNEEYDSNYYELVDSSLLLYNLYKGLLRCKTREELKDFIRPVFQARTTEKPTLENLDQFNPFSDCEYELIENVKSGPGYNDIIVKGTILKLRKR